MEVFAGFVEHTDAQVGRLIDGMDARGLRDNTLIFYIFGDNGSCAEGQQGSISELLAQNNIPNTIEQQLAALDRIGGIDALGGPGPTTCIMPAGPGRAARRSRAPSCSLPTSAAPATRWSSAGRGASRMTAPCGRSSTT